MQVTVQIEINSNNPMEVAAAKIALEKIAKNFNTDNRAKIAELSEIPDANNRLKKLFNNPLFKAALK